MRELIMALKSGLPDTVPWALNALALSSFCARPELPALPSLPGLLPVLLQVRLTLCPPHAASPECPGRGIPAP